MKRVLFVVALLTLSFSASSAMAVKLSVQENMGRHLYMDKDLSWNSTQSCATCHHRSAGFADPTNNRDPENTMVSLGDDGVSLGGRNAPTSAYCGSSPVLHKNDSGEWIGGMFWDGRKTGEILGDPLAEQAQGPPLNPVEMDMPNVTSIIIRVSEADYAHLFLKEYGDNYFVKALANEINTLAVYDDMARLIAAYERSFELNPFNSQYDKGNLTEAEARGLVAFQKAQCNACHSLSIPSGALGPVFSSYGYVNIGVPMNVVVNPEPDLGLGYVKEGQNGKFKIPTLRNIAKTAPYSHNGYFPTLEDIVSFHVDRGALVADVEENLVDPVTVDLDDQEIADIVAFLGALTDDDL